MQNALTVYQRLFTYVRPFWWMLLIGLLANMGYAGIDAGLTYLLRPFLDRGLIQLDMTFAKTIPFIILLGVTSRGLLSALGGYCMTSVARSVVMVLRQRVFSHAMRLPADYYDETTSASLMSKLLYDVEQVAQVSADALTDFIQNSCLVIGLLSVMFMICWQLSVLFLLTMPLVGAIVNYTNRRVRRLSHQVQHAMGQVTAYATDAVTGYRVVRLFGGVELEVQRFQQATNAARQQDMKVAASRAVNVSGVQCVLAIGIAAIILAAIQLTAVIQVSAGAFLAIMAAMLQLIKPMKTLTTLNTVIQRGLAGAESVFHLLDEPVERLTGKSLPKRVKGCVRFENVSYAYRSGKPVLHDVTFEILPGETVALVGHSGGGKSTITALLSGFYAPTAGQIYIDDDNLAECALQAVRAQMAFVSQEVVLFNASVFDNIAYGCVGATQAAVQQAAERAYAAGFIEQLPDQYQTVIGEKGVLLSGGQRQRLAIARALLKNAPILMLDEATSALDTESEQMIQAALKQVMKGRTTLIVAHRLSTITHADRILVLHEGRVVEQGTHEALLKLQGHYAQLIQAQEMSREWVTEPAL